MPTLGHSLWRIFLKPRVVIAGIIILTILYSLHQTCGNCGITPSSDSLLQASAISPFSGAFSRFPAVSSLSPKQRRLTVVGVWNDDDYAPYLRHFFHTIQLNADSIDLLMINRKFTPGKGCLDLQQHGIDISWGGNIVMHCIDDDEWKARHTNFVCSREHGWNCDDIQYQDVLREFEKRPDARNFNWRPLRGYVFQDLFPDPEAQFWAWIDHDNFVGNFAKYPFNILSQVSMLTGCQAMASKIFLAGQLTAWNLDDPALASAWKKIPEMQSPDHFTKYMAGRPMLESAEERYWSYAYMRSTENLPGTDLSWVVYPDLHGDDFFDGRWAKQEASQTYVISGREILLVSKSLSRAEMETLILLERNTPSDDLGNIGWTGGEDGSSWVVEQPGLTSDEASLLASRVNPEVRLHQGIVEDHAMFYNCTTKTYKQCVPLHPMAMSNPPIYRQSLVRFKEQQPDRIIRRLELDDRPRGYERKLIRHFLKAKYLEWFDFPPFEITNDLVFQVNYDSAEVWKMGSNRKETLFLRQEGKPPVG